ncbi:bile acid:sodium symporter family protein [Nocardioides sp. Bht2]|uniref:bile acid:sodium symporter family protein n=1 Tax=Nocardioides sp. Bht2 TaxID=3392297 RepID=UPI0039B5A94A
MQDSALITVGLPIALAIIMFGLGLSLTLADFARVARQPKAVIAALAVQVLVLPLITFGLVKAFDLPPLLAVGVMLLVASPGGTTANLLSHLFRGDVALNISLTAVNSVLAALTIPIVVNLSIDHFGADGELGLQYAKVLQVIAIVLVPVAIGMLVRARNQSFALAADRPVRIFSITVLAMVAIGAIIGERENVVDYFADIGVVVVLVCLISLSLGYAVALALRLGRAQAVACSMEVGIHNTTIALAIALSVLDNSTVAVPAAVYSIVMYVLAPTFGWLVSRRGPAGVEQPV